MWFDPAKDARLGFDAVLPAHRPTSGQPPEGILLTGVTGFVGAFLLNELLHQTGVPIFCLVRADDPARAMERIHTNLERYGLSPPNDSRRVVAVVGDLEKPLFGMERHRYDDLAGRVDWIVHCAAHINHVLPYLLLKQANVAATQELIRFAVQRRLKVFHFLSSTAGCVGRNRQGVILFPDERVHASPASLVSSYGLSKWVAERSLEYAAKAGVPVTIFRGGDMAGDSRTGQGKTSDFFHLFLRLFVEVGKYPASLSGEINVLPVDFAAQAVTHLALRWENGFRVVNLVHTEPMPLHSLFAMIQGHGYLLRPTELEEWVGECKEYIKQRYSRKQALVLQYLFHKESTGYLFEWYFHPYRFVTRNLTQGLEGAPFACPKLDQHLWENYFSELAGSGFLPSRTGIQEQAH